MSGDTRDPGRVRLCAVAGCAWRLDDNDNGEWESSCGERFIILAGTPAENGMRFCCYCGGAIEGASPTAADLLAALELLLPYAPTAPAWAIQAAQAAIKQARGGAK